MVSQKRTSSSALNGLRDELGTGRQCWTTPLLGGHLITLLLKYGHVKQNSRSKLKPRIKKLWAFLGGNVCGCDIKYRSGEMCG